jgi:hypothetical protein
MRRPASDLVMKRARRYAGGETRSEIVASDGVGMQRVIAALRRVVASAAESLEPSSRLPRCADWHERRDGTWYVSVPGIPSPADTTWALAILDRPELVIPVDGSTFARVLKEVGWRVELFWNSSGGWFTARLISPWDRDGNVTYPGGFLAPFDNPIGASGSTPAEALANLSEAVLEWA